jgi:hypothetical protein
LKKHLIEIYYRLENNSMAVFLAEEQRLKVSEDKFWRRNMGPRIGSGGNANLHNKVIFT